MRRLLSNLKPVQLEISLDSKVFALKSRVFALLGAKALDFGAKALDFFDFHFKPNEISSWMGFKLDGSRPA